MVELSLLLFLERIFKVASTGLEVMSRASLSKLNYPPPIEAVPQPGNASESVTALCR